MNGGAPGGDVAGSAALDAAPVSAVDNDVLADAHEGERVAGDDTVVIHRSPRYFRFMAAGAIVGVVIALVLTFAFPEPPGFNPAQILGFLGILLVVVGVAVGAVVALVIDRASRRRAKTIQVERILAAPDERDE